MSEESMKSSIRKAKGLGSAKNGTSHWYMQRITAIANIPLAIWMIWSILQLQNIPYQEFTIWLSTPLNAILMILFILNMIYHAYLGSLSVVEDYLSNTTLKTIKIISMKLFFIAAAVTAIFSILKISL